MHVIVKAAGWVGCSAAAAVIGLSSGWYAARQTTAAPGHEHGHGGHPAEAPDEHAGHAHAGPHFSEQARLNLGLEISELAPQPWGRTVSIPAVIEEAHHAARTVATPVVGRVLEVRAHAGGVVEAGAVVAVVLREPLPAPDLTLTSEILRPAGESMHDSARALRVAARNAEIQRAVVARLEKLVEPGEGGTALVPRKELIEARTVLERAEAEVSSARDELRNHGLTASQVDDIQSGGRPAFLERSAWRHALEANGLWPKEAQALSEALPEAIRDLPMVVGLVGELAARGRLSAELAAWLASDAAAAGEFLAVGSMALQGRTLEDIRALHAAGAFAPLVELRADAASDWDVHEILARPGDSVSAGQRIVVLTDPRTVRLRAQAAGADAALLVRALESGASMEASPLVAGSGPGLKKLKLRSLENDGGRATAGIATVANEVLAVKDEKGHGKFRTWKLRPGLRYVLKVPVEVPAEAFVVPAEAVLDDGAEKVVFVEDGDGFRKAKVVVRHQDAEVAALDPKSSDLFPGDRVVTRGAFAVWLAIQAAEGGGAVDPHAGHSH